MPSSFLAASLLLSSALNPQQPLDSLRDHSHALLLFAPQSQDSTFQRQLSHLSSHAADLHDRDLLLIPVLIEWKSTDKNLRHSVEPFTAPDIQSSLRQHFHVDPTRFTVILVGKDGGEKFRSHNPVTIDKLTSTIDAMPMRQQEVRDRHPN